MKSLLLATLTIIGSASFASQMPNPVLKMTKTNGTVSPEYREALTCKVYETYVSITFENAQGVNVTTTKEIILSDVTALINIAENEDVMRVSPPRAGGQQINLTAIKTKGAGAPKEILLSSSTRKRVGPASSALIGTIEHLCQ